MREVFAELDMTSDVLEILMSPDAPYFRLSTFGNAGNTHVGQCIAIDSYSGMFAMCSLRYPMTRK